MSPMNITIFKTEQALLLVDRFALYPQGMGFSLRLILRDRITDGDMPWETRGPRRQNPLSDEFLKFGIEFADGSKWTNLYWEPPHRLPTGPVVYSRGGSGGERSWRGRYWMWPLPAAGPLTFVAEWPAHGITETRATVNGAELLASAPPPEVIWPD